MSGLLYVASTFDLIKKKKKQTILATNSKKLFKKPFKKIADTQVFFTALNTLKMNLSNTMDKLKMIIQKLEYNEALHSNWPYN